MNKRRRRMLRAKKGATPPAPATSAPGAIPPLQDNVLQAAWEKLESQLLPNVRGDYDKIVVAGLRVGMEKGPNSLIAKLHQSRDPIWSCANGAVALVLLMSHQAKGVMPPAAIPPAMTTLMLQALDFADRTGIVKVGTPELVRATHLLSNMILNAFKVTPAKLQMLATKTHAVMQDPVQMDIIARRSGVVRDPRASIPTDLSQGGGNAN